MQNHCPVCSDQKISRSFLYKSKSELLKSKSINICANCSLGYMKPMPSEQDWNNYNTEYFLNAHGGINRSKSMSFFKSAPAKLRFQYISHYQARNKLKFKRVFEVGPGEGQMISVWKSYQADIEYWVDESDTSVHKELLDLGAIILQKNEKLKNHKFDLVIMSHVLEHSIDPVAFIKKATSQLKPGGLLFVEVPAEDYQYKDINEPHTLFFNKTSMAECLRRSGLKLKQCSLHGNTLISIKYFEIFRKVISKLIEQLPKKLIKILLPKRLKNIMEVNEIIVSFPLAPYKCQHSSGRWLRIIAEKQ